MKHKIFLLLIFIFSVSSFSYSQRNVLYVLINTYDQIFVEWEVVGINRLKDVVKEFIANPDDDYSHSDKFEWDIPYLGKTEISKGVVCVTCDRNTTYQKYIDVQNEIEKAFNELRNELALEKFNTSYKSLSEAKQRAINWAIPKNITEPTYVYVENK